jgi:hypothetical protein
MSEAVKVGFGNMVVIDNRVAKKRYIIGDVFAPIMLRESQVSRHFAQEWRGGIRSALSTE